MDEKPWTAEELLIVLRNGLVDQAAQAAAYRASWGDAFAMDKLTRIWKGDGPPRKITVAELMEISDERLRVLGFGSWDGALTLVPLWAYNLIADGEVLTSISGDTGRVGASREDGRPEIDLDTRFGCIAYGFTKPGAVPEPDLVELKPGMVLLDEADNKLYTIKSPNGHVIDPFNIVGESGETAQGTKRKYRRNLKGASTPGWLALKCKRTQRLFASRGP